MDFEPSQGVEQSWLYHPPQFSPPLRPVPYSLRPRRLEAFVRRPGAGGGRRFRLWGTMPAAWSWTDSASAGTTTGFGYVSMQAVVRKRAMIPVSCDAAGGGAFDPG